MKITLYLFTIIFPVQIKYYVESINNSPIIKAKQHDDHCAISGDEGGIAAADAFNQTKLRNNFGQKQMFALLRLSSSRII